VPFNGIQIQNQIDANFSAIQNINLQLRQSNLPAWKRVQMDKDLARIWNAQRYWAAEYKKATGETMLLVAPMILVGDPEEEQRTLNQRLAHEKVIQEARLRLKEGIRTAIGEYHSIRLLLQEHYDIATSWQNALFSDWARIGAGLRNQAPALSQEVD